MNDTDTALFSYAMPSLGADVDKGSVIEWLVGIGDSVERGQVVARVETEKSDVDIETWRAGVVDEILVGPDEIVPVGTVLLHLRPGETEAADLDVGAPSARGIELSEVAGSGPEGASRPSELSEADGPPSRLKRMRSMIAVRMTRSNAEIPHYRLERDIDLGSLVNHLATINAERPTDERVLAAAAFVRAVALAAKRHPELNGTWSDGRFRPGTGVNVSVAISLRGGGLVTPTIRNADTVSLDETMRLLREFTMAARSGAMRSEWTASDSSITVTNLGDRGADLVHGLISPPEVALVGFGRIMERPAVVDGAVVPRPVVVSTLAADHRATDGAAGSRFLSSLAETLEHPERR